MHCRASGSTIERRLSSNRRLIESFYAAFSRRDGPAMAACYAPDATFADPVFDVRGRDVGAMWTMLCERAIDLRIEAGEIDADEHTRRAPWEAWYTFAATGRPVHNQINSTFALSDGRIASQRDVFDLLRCRRMAF